MTEYKQGECETCGLWDSKLVGSMCPTCCKKYLKEEVKTDELEASTEVEIRER